MSRAARGLTQLLQPCRMSIFPIRPSGHSFRPHVRKWNSVGCRFPDDGFNAQRVSVAGGRNALRRANRSGIEEQLRKELGAVSRRCAAGDSMKDFECRRFRDRWNCRQVEHQSRTCGARLREPALCFVLP